MNEKLIDAVSEPSELRQRLLRWCSPAGSHARFPILQLIVVGTRMRPRSFVSWGAQERKLRRAVRDWGGSIDIGEAWEARVARCSCRSLINLRQLPRRRYTSGVLHFHRRLPNERIAKMMEILMMF